MKNFLTRASDEISRSFRFVVEVNFNTVGRLDVQTGPKGCILQCSSGSKLEEVRKDSVEGDSL